MARSVDPKAHATRREAFLAASETLLSHKRFEEMSVQDVLTATGASKGAYHHCFASKQDLLEALAERLADTVSRGMQETADAPGLSALERPNRMFAALTTTELERRDMIVAMLRVWFSDASDGRILAGTATSWAPGSDPVATRSAPFIAGVEGDAAVACSMGRP